MNQKYLRYGAIASLVYSINHTQHLRLGFNFTQRRIYSISI
ncbi:hypothetical protein [Nostoc favosum]|nr:hypothetical protein [Nostoc favosum]